MRLATLIAFVFFLPGCMSIMAGPSRPISIYITNDSSKDVRISFLLNPYEEQIGYMHVNHGNGTSLYNIAQHLPPGASLDHETYCRSQDRMTCLVYLEQGDWKPDDRFPFPVQRLGIDSRETSLSIRDDGQALVIIQNAAR